MSKYDNFGASVATRLTEKTQKKINQYTCNCGETLPECCLDAHLYITNDDEGV